MVKLRLLIQKKGWFDYLINSKIVSLQEGYTLSKMQEIYSLIEIIVHY